MKKAWKCIWFQIKKSVEISKRQILFEILIGLMEESRKMVAIFLPATILSLITEPDATPATLIVVTSANLFIVLLSFLVEYGSRTLCIDDIRFTNTMQLDMNRKTMRMNYAEIKHSGYMKCYDMASEGIWNSSEVVYMIFRIIFSRIVMIFVTFYVYARVHIMVALFVLATILIEYKLNAWNANKQHENDNENATYKHRQKYLDDTLFNQKALRDMVFNDAKSFLLQKRVGLTEKMLRIIKKNETLDFLEDAMAAFLSMGRTLFTYLVAMKQFFDGKLLLADFLLFISAAREMTWALFQMANAVEYIRKAVQYCDDYLKYMEMPETDHLEGTLQTPKCMQTLELRDVSFRYTNSEEDALHNVSLTIRSNETVAIVGDNGAGKSTLIKLLLRMYKVTSGEILLNGINIYDYRYDDYIALFSPVFQDFNLYSFTLGENIYFGNKETSSWINDVLQKVGLAEKVSSFSKGLDTPYTKRFAEDGVVFSGGEEQKLAIARALAKKNAVSLFLDEPTASLDPLAEYDMNELIHNVVTKSFLVFISHRLSTTRFADRIIVLENGTVVEEGSHNELISKTNGKYKTMYDMQSSYYKLTQS